MVSTSFIIIQKSLYMENNADDQTVITFYSMCLEIQDMYETPQIFKFLFFLGHLVHFNRLSIIVNGSRNTYFVMVTLLLHHQKMGELK